MLHYPVQFPDILTQKQNQQTKYAALSSVHFNLQHHCTKFLSSFLRDYTTSSLYIHPKSGFNISPTTKH
uniref:Uncharacterized protein n=1 Tax=Solanum tuberosum TaxID=4113 RepID=M1D377_SOLTU